MNCARWLIIVAIVACGSMLAAAGDWTWAVGYWLTVPMLLCFAAIETRQEKRR